MVTMMPTSTITAEWMLVLLVLYLVLIVLEIVQLIGMWCLLQKMGRHDFAALIPGYSQWEYARGAGFNVGFALLFVVSLIGFWAFLYGYLFTVSIPLITTSVSDPLFLYTAYSGSASLYDLVLTTLTNRLIVDVQLLNPWIIGALIAAALYLVFYLVATYGVAKSFDHGIFYMLGIIILPFIFIPILGCSRKQHYHGPHFNKELRNSNADLWDSAVRARLQAFGSNAPLALSLFGLICGMSFLSIPGVVLCIIALVRNSTDKGKPLSGAKYGATKVVSIIGIIMSILVVVLAFIYGGLFIRLLGLF